MAVQIKSKQILVLACTWLGNSKAIQAEPCGNSSGRNTLSSIQSLNECIIDDSWNRTHRINKDGAAAATEIHSDK
jgi:hypothetical protein